MRMQAAGGVRIDGPQLFEEPFAALRFRPSAQGGAQGWIPRPLGENEIVRHRLDIEAGTAAEDREPPSLSHPGDGGVGIGRVLRDAVGRAKRQETQKVMGNSLHLLGRGTGGADPKW